MLSCFCYTSSWGKLWHHDGTEIAEHKDVSTTTIYTHVINNGGMGAQGPLDTLNI